MVCKRINAMRLQIQQKKNVEFPNLTASVISDSRVNVC